MTKFKLCQIDRPNEITNKQTSKTVKRSIKWFSQMVRAVCFGVSVCNWKHVGDDVVCLVIVCIFFFLSFLPRFVWLTLCANTKNYLIDDLDFKCDVEKRNESSFFFFFFTTLSICCFRRARAPRFHSHPST